jgi:phosphoglucosamine mutase
MRKLFGTDGIRGVAGTYPLDERTTFGVGAALGDYLKRKHGQARVLIGQDTRESSDWISQSVAAGLSSRGVQAGSAGVITTPGVAYLARTRDFAAGIVISASHNPWQDNGIKVFGHDGYKLPDEVELEIESDIFGHLEAADLKPEKLPLQHDHALRREYVKWLARQVEAVDLREISAIVDCANGAATPIAHEVFAACGIPAIFVSDQPNGRNINENCGALHPEVVAALVRDQDRVTLGITFDGDADRALFSDEQGRVVNGDAVMLLCGRQMQTAGTLSGNTVVATTMSNMGLEKALRDSGICMMRAPVGDKYVLQQMNSTGATLGGEQSGHIIFRDGEATTGDGLFTALRVMSVMASEGKKLSELVADLKVFPQVIKNVRVREKQPLEHIPEVASSIRAAEQELDGNGRVVVRYSGTEALARVMIEAESEELMKRHADAIAGAIQQTIGV